MLKNTKTVKILLPILLILFLLGVINLFMLRFEKGDVYPIYSSLRADPLGVKVFYEALDNLQGISVSRNYQSLYKLKDEANATIFFFGVPAYSIHSMSEDEVKELEIMINHGARLVISFFPERRNNVSTNRLEELDKKKTEDESVENESEKTVEKEQIPDTGCPGGKCYKPISITDRWGFDLENFGATENTVKDHDEISLLATDKYNLPSSVSWHSALYFKDFEKKWDKVYERDGHAVLIERRFGSGTIILSTDTYFVSNEAMRKKRHPELLAWLVGKNKKVVFDETHFGIGERPGIAALGRQYRLHGLFAGILLLAVLFVWKNSVSFISPYDNTFMNMERDLSTGKDYISGFSSLLRRNIPSSTLLDVCFDEWEKTTQFRRRDFNEEIRQIRSKIESEKHRPAKQRNPVKVYNFINKILSERKNK